jgi:hypothetical protein
MYMKNFQRGFAPAAILVIALIAIGGGTYLYIEQKTPAKSNISPDNPTPNPTTANSQSAKCTQNNDPDGYLDKICLYVKENKLDISPAKPETLSITQIVERAQDGKTMIEIRLNCCGTGDSALIDKETGKVVQYILGIH